MFKLLESYLKRLYLVAAYRRLSLEVQKSFGGARQSFEYYKTEEISIEVYHLKLCHCSEL